MLTPEKTGRYISIKADGKLHETVTQDTEGAVLREYELKDGTKGSKWELVYKSIEAKITNIEFQDGDYGENLQITFNDGEDTVTLSQGVATNFGEDLLKKLPAVNFAEKVTLVPYAFEDEKGKARNGVTLYQNGEKVLNHFYDGEKNVHDFPEPKGDTSTYSKDQWKMYFLEVRIFLVNFAKENVLPKFADKIAPAPTTEEDVPNPEDIPFN